MTQILDTEKELELLKNAFTLAQQITVVGARQGGILATLGDNIGAVANSLFARQEALKAAPVAGCCKSKADLSLVSKEPNGEVKTEEAAH